MRFHPKSRASTDQRSGPNIARVPRVAASFSHRRATVWRNNVFLLRQSRRLVIVQFLPHDAKQDRDLRVAGDQHAVVK